MFVIGLTGKSCAGKNVVAQSFEDKGFLIIDADKLGHKALEYKRDEIIEAFGLGIIEDNKVSRKKLAPIVFSSEKQLRLLESIVHPFIKDRCIEIIEKSEKNVVINAALLERGKLVELCSNVVFVKASFCSRYKRAKKRDNISLLGFMRRNSAQKDINIKRLKQKTEVYVIVNKKTTNEINRQIDHYCDIFIEKY